MRPPRPKCTNRPRYPPGHTAVLGTVYLVPSSERNKLVLKKDNQMNHFASILLGLLGLGFATTPAEAQNAKPNIVYFIIDELGYYESSGVGHPDHRTPNIDRL